MLIAVGNFDGERIRKCTVARIISMVIFNVSWFIIFILGGVGSYLGLRRAIRNLSSNVGSVNYGGGLYWGLLTPFFVIFMTINVCFNLFVIYEWYAFRNRQYGKRAYTESEPS